MPFCIFFDDIRITLTSKICHLTKKDKDLLELVFYFFDISAPGEQKGASVNDIRNEAVWTKKYTETMLTKLRRKKIIYESCFKNAKQEKTWMLCEGLIAWKKYNNKAAKHAGDRVMKKMHTKNWATEAYYAADNEARRLVGLR